jgi:hypothetical protein
LHPSCVLQLAPRKVTTLEFFQHHFAKSGHGHGLLMTRQLISTFRQPPLPYLMRSVRRTSGFVLADDSLRMPPKHCSVYRATSLSSCGQALYSALVICIALHQLAAWTKSRAGRSSHVTMRIASLIPIANRARFIPLSWLGLHCSSCASCSHVKLRSRRCESSAS